MAVLSTEVALDRGDGILLGTFDNAHRVLVITLGGKGVTGIQWIEARDAAEHRTGRGQPPTTKNYLAQTSTLIVLRNSDTEFTRQTKSRPDN